MLWGVFSQAKKTLYMFKNAVCDNYSTRNLAIVDTTVFLTENLTIV